MKWAAFDAENRHRVARVVDEETHGPVLRAAIRELRDVAVEELQYPGSEDISWPDFVLDMLGVACDY